MELAILHQNGRQLWRGLGGNVPVDETATLAWTGWQLWHGLSGNVPADWVAEFRGIRNYAYELPDGSIIYADKAYNDYAIEDLLKEIDHIELLPIRKKNSKRALSPSICFAQNYYRKMVATTGSLIEQLLPKSIHTVTSQGFELKVALFVIAYSLNCYLNL
jgi:hypothetical protein